MSDSGSAYGGSLSMEESDFDSPVKGKKKAAPKKALKDTTNIAPIFKTAAGKKEAAKKKPTLKENDSDGDDAPVTKTKKPAKEKTNEEKYRKVTPVEHVLLRPDTYIGQTSPEEATTFLLIDGQMTETKVSYVPGLLKIFDEILVNASDHKQNDKTMNFVKVNIDQESNTISVHNNGHGIPVSIHKEHDIYVPELIFGHLLTGSNFDDDEQRTTGGRNGYGAKLCNIFSTEFTVETSDGKKNFKMTWKNNMGVRGEPKITTSDTNFTKITFKPDLKRFKMESLDDSTVAMMTKRVYDIAATTPGVKVYLNGEQLPVKNFTNYVDLHLGKSEDNEVMRISYNDKEHWEIVLSASDGQFRQVSFVNSIWTAKGGSHVNYIADQIADYIIDKLGKRKKEQKIDVKRHMVKNYMFIFVRALIVNPAFDTQTKETLTTRKSEFGSKCELPEKFLKDVMKSPIIQRIEQFAAFQADKGLKKIGGPKTRGRLSIPKLEDANNAGGKKGRDCTLILTEGDSAKGLVISGLSVVGRDNYGVFPLKGKLLNVRDSTAQQVQANEEIANIMKILGLRISERVTDEVYNKLRYGHLMIMADQDHDGSHIKGLIINFIHHYWPELLKNFNFLQEFITPIVKATPKSASRGEPQRFFTLPEYYTWKETVDVSKWTIKYYKGLGTSKDTDAYEYFSDLDRHVKEFTWDGDIANVLIDKAFNKNKANERKDWLRAVEPNTFIDHSADTINYEDFVNKELVLFSLADCMRSIPSFVDGFKPGQRKILFSCFKRKLKDSIKVAQLAGYVSEHSSYHHGEKSLQDTIVKMAQNFVGSNNVNLLYPDGNYGSRHMAGSDAASARYIYTYLMPITRYIFREEDDAVLTYCDDDGVSIEPQWYMPVIPMALVNGCEGIGTGWSTSVPSYNPSDIVANLRRKMKGEPLVPMVPWYRDFKGEIKERALKKDKSGFEMKGKVEKTSDETFRITELPVGMATQKMKELLEEFITGKEPKEAKGAKGKKAPKKKDAKKDGEEDDKKSKGTPPSILSYKEYHTDRTVDFEVKVSPEQMRAIEAVGIEKKFKVLSDIATSNMHLFDSEGHVTKYDTTEAVIDSFYPLRLEYYNKRKTHMIGKLQEDLDRASNKERFILEVVEGKLEVRNRKRKDLLAELVKRGYRAFPKAKKAKVAGDPSQGDEENAEEEEEEPGAKVKAGDYDYLLSLPLWNLTSERVQKIREERAAKEAELNLLRGKTLENLWNADLDDFEDAYKNYESSLLSDKNKRNTFRKKTKTSQKGKGRKRAAAAMDSGSDYDERPKTKKPKPAPTTIATKMQPKPKPSPVKKEVSKKDEKKAEVKPAPKKIEVGLPKVGEKRKSPEPEESDDEYKPLSQRLGDAAKSSQGSEPAAKKRKVKVSSDDEDNFDDALKAAPKKAASKPAAKPVAVSVDSDDEPVVKRAAPKKKEKAIVVEDDKENSPVVVAAPKKATATIDLGLESDDEPVVVKKPTAKAAKPKPAPKKEAEKPKKAPAKKKKKGSDSESDGGDGSGSDGGDSEVSLMEASSPPRSQRSRRATKAVNYAGLDDDDGEGDEDGEGAGDDAEEDAEEEQVSNASDDE